MFVVNSATVVSSTLSVSFNCTLSRKIPTLRCLAALINDVLSCDSSLADAGDVGPMYNKLNISEWKIYLINKMIAKIMAMCWHAFNIYHAQTCYVIP